MPRYLIVCIEDDLDRLATTKGVVMTSIRVVRGVIAVTDLSAISYETLEGWLLPEGQTYRALLLQRRRRKKDPDQT